MNAPYIIFLECLISLIVVINVAQENGNTNSSVSNHNLTNKSSNTTSQYVQSECMDKCSMTSETGQQSMPSIYIGALFEVDKSFGASEKAAAEMAIKHINEQQIIGGYRLLMVSNDTKCDPGYGADAFYDIMYRKPPIHMLVGTACSEVAQMLGEIVPYWNLVMISHGATSTVLSDRETYPSFFRLAATASSHNPARQSFIQHMNWRMVATIVQDEHSFSLANNEMIKELELANISVTAALSFRDTSADLHAKMTALKDTDARIIIGSFTEDAAKHVFCWSNEKYQIQFTESWKMNNWPVIEGHVICFANLPHDNLQISHSATSTASKLGLYGARYVWVLLGSYTDKWWTLGPVNCTKREMQRAVEGYFIAGDLTSIIGNGVAVSGLTTNEFLELYKSEHLPLPRSKYAQTAYDSVWTAALSLATVINQTYAADSYILGNSTYNDRVMFNRVMDAGPISFDGPDRRGVSVIKQLQDGKSARVALYFPVNASLLFECSGCQPIVWIGDKMPVDASIVVMEAVRLERSAVVVVSSVSLLGLIMALTFLGFNVHHSHLKHIKLSSPQLNNVAVAGCMLAYLSNILLGLDFQAVVVNHKVVCMLRACLWVFGYSLAFGAMFFKTYRVHQIFRRVNNGIIRNKLLQDGHLLLLIGCLLLLDGIIMGIWIVFDPMDKHVRNLPSYTSKADPNIIYKPQISICNSQHLQKWMGSLYAYKGLLLLFGMYMAWETRNVQIAALNDSRYIGMNIYNVLISSVAVVVLSHVLTDKPTLSYILIATLINVSTSVMLILLFVPKIYTIYRKQDNLVVTSSGMTIEGNTRRFVTDEKKELRYRAEVENRFLKRKLREIEEEITRIQKLLSLTSTNFVNARIKTPEVFEIPSKQNHKAGKRTTTTCTRPYSRMNALLKVKSQESVTDPLILSQRTTSSSINTRISHSESFPRTVSCNQTSLPELSQSDEVQFPNLAVQPSCSHRNDSEFEDMMSDMGPPGMLTFIFSNNPSNDGGQSKGCEQTHVKSSLDIETTI